MFITYLTVLVIILHKIKLGHKAYYRLLKSLSTVTVLSTYSLAQDLGHSSTSRVIQYLESLKKLHLVNEYNEIVSTLKHNCKFRSSHYLVLSDSVKRANEIQKEWRDRGLTNVDGIDIVKHINGKFILPIFCKECKKTLGYHNMGDAYRRYDNRPCTVITKNVKPVRYWRLSIKGVYYLIARLENILEIKRIVRRFSIDDDIMKFASFLRSDDLKSLSERLRVAEKLNLDPIIEVGRWRNEIHVDLSKYGNSNRREIIIMQQMNDMKKILPRVTYEHEKPILNHNDTRQIINFGVEKMKEIIQNKIEQEKNNLKLYEENTFSFNNTEQAVIKTKLSTLNYVISYLSEEWSKSMLKVMGIK